MERQQTVKLTRTNSPSRNNLQAKSALQKATPSHPVLQLQRKIGNQAVQRLLSSDGIQAKPTISQPWDKYEQEADRVADQVMRIRGPEVMPGESEAPRQSPTIQRLCTECEAEMQRQPNDEEKKKAGQLQTQTQPGQRPTINSNLQTRMRALQSGGRPLHPSERAFFEPRFGQDFSAVRTHTDVGAAETARSINATAFTVGRNIAFGAGRYASGTREGQWLLAHELTHVLQQTGEAARAKPLVQRESDGGEEEKKEGNLAAKVLGCSADQQSEIETGIRQAKGLAERAITALERDIPLSYEQKAMDAHFASPSSSQQVTIVERYKDIRDNIAGTTYTCAKKGKKVKEGNTRVDLCGEAYCPGTQIKLFPNFGKGGCPATTTILHEAAHNAGACDDIDKGKGYPPATAEANAYSYEYFASAVAAGYKEPELPKRKPKAPKVSE